MKFVDYVTITVRSGAGGAGAVAFRREKYVPRGGPSGGDGGKGGSVILEADEQLNTLIDLHYRRHHFAGNGQPGQGDNRSGKDGDDVMIRVPPGTVAVRTEDGSQLGEVVEHGDRLVLAAGGKGGRGNARFKSATNRAPRKAQPGEPGEERNITLELKLLADVGLVGFPNAGKSTLISCLSEAKPRVADYPFTTLVPTLGVVRCEDYQSFVMADIPGIIEDAHKGKGLGLRFLRHIERNAVLAFVIAADEEDPSGRFDLLLTELRAYDEDLVSKPRIVVLTKTDLLEPEGKQKTEQLVDSFPSGMTVLPVSAVTRSGLEKLKRELLRLVKHRQDVI